MGGGAGGGGFNGTKGSKSGQTRKNERFYGKPGETKTDGTTQTHIGKNGRADWEQHNTDHGHPKYHDNPHYHNIEWDTDGNPKFGKGISGTKN